MQESEVTKPKSYKDVKFFLFMAKVELTDFVANIYERFGLTREEGIAKAIIGSEKTRIKVPVYKGEKHIDDMPLSAYMILAELDSLGKTARVPEMFKDVDLSGFTDGYVSGILACLATRGFVETEAPISLVVLSEDKEESRHIQYPDGSTHVVYRDGSSRCLSVGGPPPGLSTNVYKLKDLKPYNVRLE